MVIFRTRFGAKSGCKLQPDFEVFFGIYWKPFQISFLPPRLSLMAFWAGECIYLWPGHAPRHAWVSLGPARDAPVGVPSHNPRRGASIWDVVLRRKGGSRRSRPSFEPTALALAPAHTHQAVWKPRRGTTADGQVGSRPMVVNIVFAIVVRLM